MVPQPVRRVRRTWREFRGQPDIPGRNWNDSAGGPNTNVGGFAGTTWAMVEAGGCPVELTYELETVGRNDFNGTLPGAFTAHPKVDPDTGEMHAMVYAWAEWLDHVQYVVVGNDGRVRRTVDIPLPGMTMLHDMSLTQRYAVVYDQPCTVDLDLAFAGRFPFRWNPDYGNRVGLLPREGGAGDIVWVDAPLCYSFHPLNAYDTDDGSIVIDLCVYDVMFAKRSPRTVRRRRHGHGSSGGRSIRRRAPMSVDVVDDTPNEFPRHRGSLTAKPHRYGYCASAVDRSTCRMADAQARLRDRARASCSTTAPGRAAGEPVFVARPGCDRRGRRVAGHVRPRPAHRARRVRRARRPGLRPRLRRPGPAPPAGAVRLPRQLGQRPLGRRRGPLL